MTKTLKTGMIAGMALATVFASAQGISVQVNGEPVYFRAQQPIQTQGRVMVPLRGVFEKLGANVTWHPETDTVQAIKGNDDIRVRIGSHTAQVNGAYKQLDVAPMLRNGTTLVPLRFLSESLGAQVNWISNDRMVTILTTDANMNPGGNQSWDNRNDNNRPSRIDNDNMFVLEENTVLPVTLNTRLSSQSSRNGDRFSGTVETNDRDRYLGLPDGTRIEGHVVTARPQTGSDPGVLELDFDRIRLPDGRSVPIEGSLISLDNQSIQYRSDGTVVARETSRDNRMVYAGYGAGAGLLVGVLTKRPLENAILGGILGYAVGSLTKPQGRPNNVTIQPGTRFGVRLDRQVALNFNR